MVIVQGYVDMPDPWRYAGRGKAEHRYDSQILDPVLDRDAPFRQFIRQWRIDDDLRRRLVRNCLDGSKAEHFSRGRNRARIVRSLLRTGDWLPAVGKPWRLSLSDGGN